ncbi:MAG: hypothetical protein M1819_004647 [Sarea resinae]|nr:MAG: hypothetical protein M1819_004647 [Sarea resinae]
MPTLKQIKCNIELATADQPLKELGTMYGDGYVESYVVVPPVPTPFKIRLTSTGYIAPGLAMFVYMDGVYQCNRNRYDLKCLHQEVDKSRYEVDFCVRQKEERYSDGTWLGKEWKFEKFKDIFTDGPHDLSSAEPGSIEQLGTIDVVVLRCQKGPRALEFTSEPEASNGTDQDASADKYIFVPGNVSKRVPAAFNKPPSIGRYLFKIFMGSPAKNSTVSKKQPVEPEAAAVSSPMLSSNMDDVFEGVGDLGGIFGGDGSRDDDRFERDQNGHRKWTYSMIGRDTGVYHPVGSSSAGPGRRQPSEQDSFEHYSQDWGRSRGIKNRDGLDSSRPQAPRPPRDLKDSSGNRGLRISTDNDPQNPSASPSIVIQVNAPAKKKPRKQKRTESLEPDPTESEFKPFHSPHQRSSGFGWYGASQNNPSQYTAHYGQSTPSASEGYRRDQFYPGSGLTETTHATRGSGTTYFARPGETWEPENLSQYSQTSSRSSDKASEKLETNSIAESRRSVHWARGPPRIVHVQDPHPGNSAPVQHSPKVPGAWVQASIQEPPVARILDIPQPRQSPKVPGAWVQSSNQAPPQDTQVNSSWMSEKQHSPAPVQTNEWIASSQGDIIVSGGSGLAKEGNDWSGGPSEDVQGSPPTSYNGDDLNWQDKTKEPENAAWDNSNTQAPQGTDRDGNWQEEQQGADDWATMTEPAQNNEPDTDNWEGHQKGPDGWDNSDQHPNNSAAGNCEARKAVGAGDDPWESSPNHPESRQLVSVKKSSRRSKKSGRRSSPALGPRVGQSAPSWSMTSKNSDKIPEGEVQSRSTSHQIRAGTPVLYSHKMHRPTYMDSHEQPYAVFRFRYRSKEALEQLFGCSIAEDPEDEKIRLSTLSKEEIIEELMREKASRMNLGTEPFQTDNRSDSSSDGSLSTVRNGSDTDQKTLGWDMPNDNTQAQNRPPSQTQTQSRAPTAQGSQSASPGKSIKPAWAKDGANVRQQKGIVAPQEQATWQTHGNAAKAENKGWMNSVSPKQVQPKKAGRDTGASHPAQQKVNAMPEPAGQATEVEAMDW